VWRYNIRLQRAAKHAAVPKYRTVVVFCGQQATCSWMIHEHDGMYSVKWYLCSPDHCKYCWTSKHVYGRCDLSTAGTCVLRRPHRILCTVRVTTLLVPAIQSDLLHTFAQSNSTLRTKVPLSRNLQPWSWPRTFAPTLASSLPSAPDRYFRCPMDGDKYRTVSTAGGKGTRPRRGQCRNTCVTARPV